MASLTTSVARLASRVQWATVGSSAVAGNVTKLSAGIALHGLSLAIAGEVVRAAAFITGRGAVADKATTAADEAATSGTSATPDRSCARSRAVASKVTDLAAGVATTSLRTTAHAESRAISLDVSETLAVVALLSLSSPRVRAVVALMAGLLAVVAQTFTAGADLGVVADIAAFVAGTARKGRHLCQ